MYFFACVVTGVGYWSAPLVKNFVNCVIYEESFVYELPMKAAVPFDTTVWQNYVIVFVVYLVSIYEAIMISVRCLLSSILIIF